ncbi:ABC transporter ATP-binding protein [Falsiroseomonas sp. HC035]|uniref:ABC transporter ATP-binding protein n=1 Tax=Falsiroseomonas sp. HC035 TaxID=3390999 RepID=UPI003D3151DA
MIPALEFNAVEGGYEPGLPILRGASLSVAPGEIVALLGPNGAGKSTLVKAAAGLVPIWSGSVLLGGRDITRVPAHRMVQEGLGFVPQTENIFANLSVLENLQLAAALVPKARRGDIGKLFELFPDLHRQRRLAAGRLSGGQRQMLAVARALVATPSVLMLDEPSAGLSPLLVGTVFERLRVVRDAGVTILLVEQNVKAALAIADRAVVLVEGRERLVGRAADLATDPRLASLYLGIH